jgi:hypothetical protein
MHITRTLGLDCSVLVKLRLGSSSREISDDFHPPEILPQYTLMAEEAFCNIPSSFCVVACSCARLHECLSVLGRHSGTYHSVDEIPGSVRTAHSVSMIISPLELENDLQIVKPC